MRYVLFYESAEDIASKAPPLFPEHWARCLEFRDRGVLELVGTFGDPQARGVHRPAARLARSTAGRAGQFARWSFTRPHACMSA